MKMKKIGEWKLTSTSPREKERVEASFLEYLMKGGLPNKVANIQIGFPHIDNGCLTKNQIVAYIDGSDATELESQTAHQFVKKSIVDPFIGKYKFRKPDQIVLIDFHQSPTILKLSGKTRVAIAKLLGFKKSTPEGIEMKEAANGQSYVLVKSIFPRETTIRILKSWTFENGGKFRYEDIQ